MIRSGLLWKFWILCLFYCVLVNGQGMTRSDLQRLRDAATTGRWTGLYPWREFVHEVETQFRAIDRKYSFLNHHVLIEHIKLLPSDDGMTYKIDLLAFFSQDGINHVRSYSMTFPRLQRLDLHISLGHATSWPRGSTLNLSANEHRFPYRWAALRSQPATITPPVAVHLASEAVARRWPQESLQFSSLSLDYNKSDQRIHDKIEPHSFYYTVQFAKTSSQSINLLPGLDPRVYIALSGQPDQIAFG